MKKRLAQAGLVAAAFSLASGPVTAWAAEAPAGTAEAAALEIPDILTISGTDATANDGGGAAHADVLALGGQTLIGGGQEGAGEAGDTTIDTEETPLGRLELLTWDAAVDEDSAESRAAVARLMLLAPEVLVVNLLQSESGATWTPMASTGTGSSDGATANLGGDALRLVLLHNEASSNGTGDAYLVSINDNVIGGPDNAALCTLSLPSVLRVACLAVSGGVGQAASSVANVGLGDDALTANAFAASVTSGTGVEIGPSVELPAADPGDRVRELGLAVTGLPITALAAIAIALVAFGLALRAGTVKAWAFEGDAGSSRLQ